MAYAMQSFKLSWASHTHTQRLHQILNIAAVRTEV